MWLTGVFYKRGAQFRLPLVTVGDRHLVYEYDGLSASLIISDVADSSSWTPLSGTVDQTLHERHILGSADRFTEFLGLFDCLTAQYVDGPPLPHTKFISLMNCEHDAHHDFRRRVVGPLRKHAELVGHLQWAWHYFRIQEDSLASLHILEGLECADRATPTAFLLSSQRISEVAELFVILRARLGLRNHIRRGETQLAITSASSDLDKVTGGIRGCRQYTVALYELALAHEQDSVRMAIQDRTALDGPRQLLERARELLEECLRRVETLDLSAPHNQILRAAVHLGLARTVDRTSVEPHEKSAGVAAAHLQQAFGFLTSPQVIASGLAGVAKNMLGCCLFEMNLWADAVDTWRVLGIDQTCHSGVRAAAIYNISLVQCLRGEYTAAIADIDTLTTLAPGYKNGFYAYVLRSLSRSEPTVHATATAGALFRHVYSQRQAYPSDAATVLSRAFGSLAEGPVPLQPAAVRAVAEVIRNRHSGTPAQDLLLVKRGVQWLEHHLLALSGRLSLDGAGLPAAAFQHLTSKTRWALYQFALEDHLGLSGSEQLEVLLSETLLSEYERQVFVPLRLIHRSTGAASWPYIPSPSAPVVRQAKSVGASSGPSGVVKKTDEKDPANYEWVYQFDDLFTGGVEWSLLEMLLRPRPRPFAAQLRSDIKGMSRSQSDLVAVLIGQSEVNDGIWRGSISSRSEETNRLREAVKLMKAIRDAAAHSVVGALGNRCDQAKDAWAYVLLTILLGRGLIKPQDIGGASPWSSGSADLRSRWATRLAQSPS